MKGLEKFSFHSNPKERQCQRMLKLLHNCAHLTGASLIAQLVKNPPTMQETLVRFLGREDPLEKG